MIDLIKKLEALEAPCRKVDMLIETLQTGNRQHPYLVGINIDDKPDAGRTTYPTPHYTTSIDAAMTLVPEGWSVKCYFMPRGIGNEVHVGCSVGKSTTPAIALCIAALRAQEASHDGR